MPCSEAFCADQKNYLFEKATTCPIGRNAVKFASKMEIISFCSEKSNRDIHTSTSYRETTQNATRRDMLIR